MSSPTIAGTGVPVADVTPATSAAVGSPRRVSLTGWIVVGAVVLLAWFLVVAATSLSPNSGIKDAAAALLLISAVAVGIERLLEVFWDFVENTRGTFWPLTAIDKQIMSLVDDLTDASTGPLARLDAAAKSAVDGTNWTAAQAANFGEELDRLRAQTAALKQLAPTNDNAQAIAKYAESGLSEIGKRYAQMKADVDLAKDAATSVSNFVGSLTDNPGRRVLSIYIGALLGLAVALLLSLDMFNAILGTPLQVNVLDALAVQLGVGAITLKLGVAATGVVMGLGSNPTHEAIKLLQRVKENQKPTATTPNAA